MQTMPRRCVVGGCSVTAGVDKAPLHSWPSDETVAACWVRFVRTTRQDTFSLTPQHANICALHFNLDSFDNYQGWKNGYGRLRLSAGAVPTIKDPQHSPTGLYAVSNSGGAPPKRPPSFLLQPPEPSKARKKLDANRVMASSSRSVPDETASQATQTAAIQIPQKSKGNQATPAARAIGQQCSVPSESRGCQACVSTATVECQCALSVEEEQEWEDEEVIKDEDFKPPSTQKPSSNSQEDYVFVSRQRLLQLLAVCCLCGSPAWVTERRDKLLSSGTLFTADIQCTSDACQHRRQWQNQRIVRNLPILNLLVSAAIFASGSIVTKALRMLVLMKVRCTSLSTVHRHIGKYLVPHTLMAWGRQQQTLLAAARLKADNGEKLVLQGDCRSDSPGHCAKYGTYSFIDGRTGNVIASELVQSNEVASSYHCEKEGLVRCLAAVGRDLVGTLITDRHRQIAKYIRETLPGCLHLFDVWHVAKGIQKKIMAASKVKDCDVLGRWKRSITNHLYWCVRTTPEGNGDMVVAKWLSILDHVANKHTNFEDPLYPSCSHAPIIEPKEWIDYGTKPHVKLEKIVTPKMLAKDIKNLSRTVQTSSLESYHALLLQFLPKQRAYSYFGMQARTALSILHWNANAGREQATTKDGKKRFDISYPKVKRGQPAVRKIKTKTTYAYAHDLVNTLIHQYEENPAAMKQYRATLRERPRDLAAEYERAEKEVIINGYCARFARDGLEIDQRQQEDLVGEEEDSEEDSEVYSEEDSGEDSD